MKRTIVHAFSAAALIAVAAQAGPDLEPSHLNHIKDYMVPPPKGMRTQGVQALGTPSVPDGSVVEYTIFGVPCCQTETMVRFNGKHTALLIKPADLARAGIAKVRRIIDEQDIQYQTMMELTGEEPFGDDLLTVALTANTCGGGCGWIGSKGIEILDFLVHDNGYMGYLVHEMNHNFDHTPTHGVSEFLFNGADRAHAWTAGMDAFSPFFSNKGERNLNPQDAVTLHADERLGFYKDFPGHNWQECVVNLTCDPAGDLDPAGLSLFTQGGVVLTVAKLHGREAAQGWVTQAKSLIASRGLDPFAMTPQQKSDLMVEALGLAVKADISCYFDALDWPVSASVDAALGAFGPNPRCVDSDADGFTAFNLDCKENDASVKPGGTEVSDGKDNDCDRAVDEVAVNESGDFPDDDATAQPISLPVTIHGAIQAVPDPEFWRYTVSGPTTIKVVYKSLGALSGYMGIQKPGGEHLMHVGPGATVTSKVEVTAGSWYIRLAPEVTVGQYEILVFADYAFPEAEHFWPLTFTPAPADRTGANQYVFNLPPVPASLTGLPNVTANLWGSRVGVLGSLPAGAANPFVWNAPAGTDPNQVAFRVGYRSNATPAHPLSQSASLLGPIDWVSEDVGSVAIAGSSESFGEKDITVRGSGADIWGTADAFRFVHLPLKGDGEIVARVVNVANTDANAKAGVMLRETTATGARNVLAALNASGQFTFQRRTTAGGTTVSTKVAVATPSWVRLTRVGNVFTAFRSDNGTSWTQVGNVTIAMAAQVEAGLAVTSHDNAELGSGGFDNVKLFEGVAGTALPAPFESAEVGATGVVGGSAFSGGTFTIKGSGADIWGAADAFRFVWHALDGDGTVTARVASVQNTNGFAKAGVMIRESFDPGSPNALMAVTPTNGVTFQTRAALGGTTVSTRLAGIVAPRWVRLTRAGNSLTAFHSADGSAWTPLGTAMTVPMTRTVLVGLAVTSHNNPVLCQATFTNVGVAAANPWTRTDIGSVGVPGSSTVGTSSITVAGSGADIWGTADAFTFLNRPISGDGYVQVRVASQQNTNAWAKAGVMIRETLAAGSKHAMIVVSPTNGTAFQRRTATGGSSSNTGSVGAAPYWLRIERSGSTFRALRSPDGVAWTEVGSATLTMAANAFMGLAVCSHNNTVTSTAVFDGVQAQE